MPKGSKKRKAAKKKQENQPTISSSASTHSHDVKQHDGLIINSTDDSSGFKINSSVDRDFEFGAKSNRANGGVDHDEAAKSSNGRSSSNSSSGNSSDEEDHSRPKESIILEENEKKSSLEANVQSVEKKTATVFDQKVFATQETAGSAFVDNGVEQEKKSAVTEPLLDRSPCPQKKTSWRNCCGLFEVFTGSGS